MVRLSIFGIVMENPLTWTPTQKVIADAILKYQELAEAGVIGYSLATTIYKVLVKHGIIEEPVEAK